MGVCLHECGRMCRRFARARTYTCMSIVRVHACMCRLRMHACTFCGRMLACDCVHVRSVGALARVYMCGCVCASACAYMRVHARVRVCVRSRAYILFFPLPFLFPLLFHGIIRKIHSLHSSFLISQTTIVVFKINSSFIFFQNYYLTILKLLE